MNHDAGVTVCESAAEWSEGEEDSDEESHPKAMMSRVTANEDELNSLRSEDSIRQNQREELSLVKIVGQIERGEPPDAR